MAGEQCKFTAVSGTATRTATRDERVDGISVDKNEDVQVRGSVIRPDRVPVVASVVGTTAGKRERRGSVAVLCRRFGDAYPRCLLIPTVSTLRLLCGTPMEFGGGELEKQFRRRKFPVQFAYCGCQLKVKGFAMAIIVCNFAA